MADTTIPARAFASLLEDLEKANLRVAERFPGDAPTRQPVHTVYGGAHLFKANTAQKFGAIALRALEHDAPDPNSLAAILGCAPELAGRVYPRVVDKLTREPVEDFRIDFEDGFGQRSDEEEDRFALNAAGELAASWAAGSLPSGVGIRIKPLNEELQRRSLRTLDVFLTRLLERTGGTLPPNFVITLPKITAPEQVAALASVCHVFERASELPPGTLQVELMIETPQAIVAEDGTVALPRLVTEGRGRVVATHFGTYDYLAACGITAANQHMQHPACDFAKHMMQTSLAGTGIRLSDGATTLLPIGPHRASPGGPPLPPDEIEENRRVVHRAWRLHADNVRHSLAGGFYQGWDLHPAQLPIRYAAVFAFFLDGLETASERLRHFVEAAAQATRVGDVFDDAATGQGLLNYFLRAMSCGAITEAEAVAMTGATLDEVRSRSFSRILQNRAAAR